jgi:hypothetical protein
MMFHASVPADDPERVARVVAEIWQGVALPFPPWPGAFVAMAGDARNTTMECYPRAQVVSPGDADGMARPRHEPSSGRYTSFHLAIGTPRTADEILAIGEREGWRAVRCNRGGVFDVVELWLENAVLVEVLTPEMQADYLKGVRIDAWRERLATGWGAAPPA